MIKKECLVSWVFPLPCPNQKLPPHTDQDPVLLASEGANVTADWGTDHMIQGREGADGKRKGGAWLTLGVAHQMMVGPDQMIDSQRARDNPP